MEQKRSRGRRVLAGLLALAILAGSALPSQAAGGGPSFGTIKENDMVPDAYCWTMHYRKGATEAEPFGNISQEAWKQYMNNGQLAHAKHQAVALVEENTPGQYGCWYRNVGQYKGKTVDFKVTVTGIRGAKERYDMTRVLALYKGQTPTSSWKNNLVKPCITFWTNRIGVFLVAVENADLRFEYYDHATGRLLEGIKGHGTFADLDGQQQVGFGNDSHINHVYRLAGSHNISYRTEDGKTIALSADGSTSSSDKEGWLSWVFESNTLQFTFGYPRVIGGWDAADADTLDTKYNGDKAAYIAGLKRAYTSGDGTCYAEDYNGTPRYFEYAFFEFTSYMLGKFEPSKQHNKMVGDVGDAMDTLADAHEKEDPYRIYAYDEFEYQTSYYVMPVKLSSFEFQDTLADCLAINGAHKVQITDNYGMDVTDDFIVKVSGQTVTCTAKEGALADDGFTNNRTYTLHLTAHRKEGGDVSPWLINAVAKARPVGCLAYEEALQTPGITTFTIDQGNLLPGQDGGGNYIVRLPGTQGKEYLAVPPGELYVLGNGRTYVAALRPDCAYPVMDRTGTLLEKRLPEEIKKHWEKADPKQFLKTASKTIGKVPKVGKKPML